MIEAVRPHVMQALRFGAVGVLNTCAGLGTMYLLMWIGLAPVPANVLGHCVGLTVSYFLNRSFTFRGGRRDGSAIRFIVTFLVALGVNVLVLKAVIEGAGIDPYLAQIVASVSYTVVFFLMSKFYVFTGAR